MIYITHEFVSFSPGTFVLTAPNYGPSFPHLSAAAAGAAGNLDHLAHVINNHSRAQVLRQDKDQGCLWLD